MKAMILSRKMGKVFNVGTKMNVHNRKAKSKHYLLKWKYFANMLLRGTKERSLSSQGRLIRLVR